MTTTLENAWGKKPAHIYPPPVPPPVLPPPPAPPTLSSTNPSYYESPKQDGNSLLDALRMLLAQSDNYVVSKMTDLHRSFAQQTKQYMGSVGVSPEPLTNWSKYNFYAILTFGLILIGIAVAILVVHNSKLNTVLKVLRSSSRISNLANPGMFS